MATLATYNGSNDDTTNFGTTVREAQSFKIATGKKITGVGLRGSRGSSYANGTFKIEIYEGGTNPQNGTLKYSETFNTSILPAYTTTPTMQTINFASEVTSLTGGDTQYYYVITVLTGNTNDEMRWSKDTTSPTYADGYNWYYSSGTWYTNVGSDHNFEVYGGDDVATNTSNFFMLLK